ncbi:MAG: SpoIIE family protein phosphatase [Flavobacteriia bacterium]|nr:SpoIIE family protein phosphatase [Flavobacteriia bacterium]
MEQLNKKYHYFEVINKFAVELLEAQTEDDIVWTLAKNAIAELGYVDCVVYLYDEYSNQLIQKAAHGPKSPVSYEVFNPIPLKLGQGIVGSVALSGKGEIIEDTSLDQRYIADDMIRFSEIAVPIIYRKKVIGIIDSEHPEKNFYTNDDLQILTTIASMTATKLIQTKSTEELIRLKRNLEKIVSERTLELKKVIIKVNKQKSEITESIHYAKRIQKAILPPQKLIESYFNDFFVYYQPKDIVAGDFYWLEKINNEIIFSVADCTGHGVSGAMVSIVCHNALNRAICEFQLLEPSKILNKVKELVVATFEKSEEQVLDGMDIALCSLDTKTRILKYAGANNPLYIIRQGELLEIKADKQPIGKYELNTSFTAHEFQLEKGDSIYIFSDGFPDQFGGEKGKKYKYKAFKELLIRIQLYPMKEQEMLLRKEFLSWKGKLDQLDDVTIIGITV